VVVSFIGAGNRSTRSSKTDEILQEIAKLSEFADVYDICEGYALWFCLIGSGALVTGYFAVAFWTLASERQIKRIRQKFFESVMRQEIGWFDTHESGEPLLFCNSSIFNKVRPRISADWG
jgi:ABC-type multidrug transport system fused ATPase/permease subunit